MKSKKEELEKWKDIAKMDSIPKDIDWKPKNTWLKIKAKLQSQKVKNNEEVTSLKNTAISNRSKKLSSIFLFSGQLKAQAVIKLVAVLVVSLASIYIYDTFEDQTFIKQTTSYISSIKKQSKQSDQKIKGKLLSLQAVQELPQINLTYDLDSQVPTYNKINLSKYKIKYNCPINKVTETQLKGISTRKAVVHKKIFPASLFVGTTINTNRQFMPTIGVSMETQIFKNKSLAKNRKVKHFLSFVLQQEFNLALGKQFLNDQSPDSKATDTQEQFSIAAPLWLKVGYLVKKEKGTFGILTGLNMNHAFNNLNRHSLNQRIDLIAKVNHDRMVINPHVTFNSKFENLAVGLTLGFQILNRKV